MNKKDLKDQINKLSSQFRELENELDKEDKTECVDSLKKFGKVTALKNLNKSEHF